jgi:hypothetical protein
MVVGAWAVVVVGASVLGTVVGAIVVAGVAAVLVAAAVDVADSDVEVDSDVEPDSDVAVDSEVVVVDADPATDTAESSTKSSLACGRPAMATPATAPTMTTARANGQDLRMRPVKLPAQSRHGLHPLTTSGR